MIRKMAKHTSSFLYSLYGCEYLYDYDGIDGDYDGIDGDYDGIDGDDGGDRWS